MRPRTIAVLVVIGILAIAGGWYFGTAQQPTEQQAYNGGRLMFPDLASKLPDAARIEIIHQGKTTTLTMLAGFEQPSAGRIFVGAEDITNVAVEKRGIGMVFQNYALFPNMTVGENIGFPLKVRRLPAAEIADRVKRALSMVRLEGLADRRPQQLSGGQQQRVAVARALAGRPAILLADEPTGNLDSRNGEAVMNLLRELHREGATICMVTHDPRYADYADRKIQLFDGRVVDENTLIDLSQRRAAKA